MKRNMQFLAAGLLSMTMTATAALADPTNHGHPPATRPTPRPAPKPARPKAAPKPVKPAPKPALKPAPKPKPVNPVAPKPGPGGTNKLAPGKPANGGTPSVTITNVNTNTNRPAPVRNLPPRVDVRRAQPRDGRTGPGDVVLRPRVMPGTGVLLVPASGIATAAVGDPGPADAPVPTSYTPVQTAPAADPTPDEPELSVTPTPLLRLTERRLAIRNTTTETVRVYVQRYTQTDDGTWTWLPADPRTATEAAEFRVETGKTAALATEDGELTAQRVRLWAVSDSGRTWDLYRDADLTLVPERDAAGRAAYEAAAIETVTLRIDG